MTGSPLILGQTQREDLVRLRHKAVSEPVDARAVIEQIKSADGIEAHFKRMQEFTISIPTVFMVTFTIETGHPVGVCRHMSMSSNNRGRAPTPAAVWMVCQELGFTGGLEHCMVRLEEIDGGDKAISVVQPLNAVDGNERWQ